MRRGSPRQLFDPEALACAVAEIAPHIAGGSELKVESCLELVAAHAFCRRRCPREAVWELMSALTAYLRLFGGVRRRARLLHMTNSTLWWRSRAGKVHADVLFAVRIGRDTRDLQRLGLLDVIKAGREQFGANFTGATAVVMPAPALSFDVEPVNAAIHDRVPVRSLRRLA